MDEAAVRRHLLQTFNIEIGAGLGPLAGRIWRVGIMGSGSTLANVLLFLTAFERALQSAGYGARRRHRGRGRRSRGGLTRTLARQRCASRARDGEGRTL